MQNFMIFLCEKKSCCQKKIVRLEKSEVNARNILADEPGREDVKAALDDIVNVINRCKVLIEFIEEVEEYLPENKWKILTDDECSYPECFEFVFVQDEHGNRYVASCDSNYEWMITNGEDSLPLLSNIIKWRKLED